MIIKSTTESVTVMNGIIRGQVLEMALQNDTD